MTSDRQVAPVGRERCRKVARPPASPGRSGQKGWSRRARHVFRVEGSLSLRSEQTPGNDSDGEVPQADPPAGTHATISGQEETSAVPRFPERRNSHEDHQRRLDAFRHFQSERADVTINDLERRPEPGRVLVVPLGEVQSFHLLLHDVGHGCRPQPNNARIWSAVTESPAARPWIPSMPEPIHAPRVLAPLYVVRRQPGMTFSRSNPAPPPVGSDSHTRIPL